MITIIIPTIGREKTIKEAIDSAKLCSCKYVLEILVVDNSQNKKYNNYIHEICNDDSRCKIIEYNTRLDINNSWNCALKNAKYDWVLFLHDDDILISSKIDEIGKYLDKKYGFIYCNFVTLFENGKKIICRYKKNRSNTINIINQCPRFVSTIINREKLVESNYWNSEYGYFSDYVKFLTIAKNSEVLYINKVLGIYRVHKQASSILKNRKNGYQNYIGSTVKELFALYDNENIRENILIKCIQSSSGKKENIFIRIVKKILELCGYQVSLLVSKY